MREIVKGSGWSQKSGKADGLRGATSTWVIVSTVFCRLQVMTKFSEHMISIFLKKLKLKY